MARIDEGAFGCLSVPQHLLELAGSFLAREYRGAAMSEG